MKSDQPNMTHIYLDMVEMMSCNFTKQYKLAVGSWHIPFISSKFFTSLDTNPLELHRLVEREKKEEKKRN